MNDITQILSQIEQGEATNVGRLLPLVYEELRKLAAVKLANEQPGQTLQPTALVHEAYLRLVDTDRAQHWNSRGHFFGAAAEAMRRILVDRARARQSLKRGGDRVRVEVAELEDRSSTSQVDLLALDEALEAFSAVDPRRAELVKLRFFAGLTNQQAAEALGVSTSTADNDWTYAKAWLRTRMDG